MNVKFFREFDWRGFDVVIIDEAHNLRSDTTSRFSNFMEKFKSVNPHADVILITATPINNRIQDLANEIKLIENKGKFLLSIGTVFDRFKLECAIILTNLLLCGSFWSILPYGQSFPLMDYFSCSNFK